MDRRRIILEPGTEGYGTFKKVTKSEHASMPSVIKFGGCSYKDRSTAYCASDMTSSIEYRIPGTIGDNDLEFHVEFDENLDSSNIAETMIYSNIYNLKTDLANDAYATYTRDSLLSTFAIYEIDDASYQAMSVMNFDFFPKVFVEHNGETKKIINKAVCVLKSYTLKKAWVMIDGNAMIGDCNISNHDIRTIILDSGIILTAAEKTVDGDSTRFKNSIGLHSNLRGAFITPATYSPLNDVVQDASIGNLTDEKTSAVSYAICKQADYFRQMSYSNGSSDVGKAKYVIRSLESVKDDNELPLSSIDNLKKNHIYTTDPRNYTTRRCYDVYHLDDDWLESRYFDDVTASGTDTYEIFVFIATYARYVMIYADAADDANITADDIRGYLMKGNRFMWPYDLQNSELFKFNGGGCKVAEVLIPIYEDGSHTAANDPIGTTAIIDNIKEIGFPKDISYDFGINIGQAYKAPDTADECVLPYIYKDNVYAQQYYRHELPKVLSNDMNLFELRQFSAVDQVFDVIGGTETALVNANDADESKPQTSEAIKIDGDGICDDLKNAGYRDDTANPSIFARDTECRSMLASNLEKMIFGKMSITEVKETMYGPSYGAIIGYKGTDLHGYSCAFAALNKNSALQRTITTTAESRTLTEIVAPYKTTDATDYYIMPLNVDGISNISFDHDVYVVY